MNPDNVVVVAIRVQPRGSLSEIQGVEDGRLRIKTTAPPAEGKANKDVIRQLAKEFGVPPSPHIEIRRVESQQNDCNFRSRRFAGMATGGESEIPGLVGSTKDQSATIIGILTNGWGGLGIGQATLMGYSLQELLYRTGERKA